MSKSLPAGPAQLVPAYSCNQQSVCHGVLDNGLSQRLGQHFVPLLTSTELCPKTVRYVNNHRAATSWLMPQSLCLPW